MTELPQALAPLGAFNQFILWIMAGDKKLPIDYRTGEVADAHDPNVWLTADEAIAVSQAYGAGVGFVFTGKDPFFFLDIDKCLEPDGVTWSPLAMDLLSRLPGAAVEVSQSGRGLHIFGTGTPPSGHANKNISLGIELYTKERFVALTGTNAIGSADTVCDAYLPYLTALYFPPREIVGVTEWTDSPVPEWNGPKDDEELIAKMLKAGGASAAFGGKATFKDLWIANEDALSVAYPDTEGQRTYDGSSADAALAQHLAFWTGKDCERMDRLMRRSALVRDKWEREDYLRRTIIRSVSMQKEVYGTKEKPVKVPIESASSAMVKEAQIVSGYQYLHASLQIEFFKGCVYIQDSHRVLVPNGALLKSEQFNATYGGYVFQLDETGDKTTRKAWEAFTESQVVRYPKAESACFRPDLQPGGIVEIDGRTLVNTYVPIMTPSLQGDPGPFLTHLRKLLPDTRDQEILLSYMAACVQYKGVKFQWTPLIQGAEGNGKTLLTRCVAAAIGDKYTHFPPANEITEKFNAWLFDKLFIGVEDVYVADHKKEVIEVLKPMITNNKLAKRAMQMDQVTADVCANFMLNSNHKDAIRKTRTDRRFAVFYTAQQTEEDIVRDGMDGDYFPKLYAWLRSGGYAIVHAYLGTYQIKDEFNPATNCMRAPITSSTAEAIMSSVGSVEQIIIGAIEEGRVGFAGGWVSSVAVERLLQETRNAAKIPHNKRRELMQSLGYDWHPALHDGRVNNPILLDENKKPRLFVKNGSILAKNLTTAAEVQKHYIDAQMQGGGVEVAETPGKVFGAS